MTNVKKAVSKNCIVAKGNMSLQSSGLNMFLLSPKLKDSCVFNINLQEERLTNRMKKDKMDPNSKNSKMPFTLIH